MPKQDHATLIASSRTVVEASRAIIVRVTERMDVLAVAGKTHRALVSSQTSLRRLQRLLDGHYGIFGVAMEDASDVRADSAYRHFLETLSHGRRD